MFKKALAVAVAAGIMTGCANVPMASKAESNKMKEFNAPSEGNSGIYVYRPSSFGGALKKDVWLNGKCVGESAPYVFFYEQVKKGEHKLSTESEFSPNDLIVKTESGKNYFVKQYIKPGVFVGGAGLELVDESKGKSEIMELDMAKKGKCSS